MGNQATGKDIVAVVRRLIDEQGFDCVGTCTASEVKVHEEVRDSCADGKCQVYGTNWSCPPACGTIYDFERRMHEHEYCTVVQSVGQLEDDFDVEVIMGTGELQVKRFRALVDALADAGLSSQVMTLSAGACNLCKECTYPDAPCRFPDKQLTSMEGSGLLVSEVCTQAGIPYNHGPLTIAYSCCVLYG